MSFSALICLEFARTHHPTNGYKLLVLQCNLLSVCGTVNRRLPFCRIYCHLSGRERVEPHTTRWLQGCGGVGTYGLLGQGSMKLHPHRQIAWHWHFIWRGFKCCFFHYDIHIYIQITWYVFYANCCHILQKDSCSCRDLATTGSSIVASHTGCRVTEFVCLVQQHLVTGHVSAIW